MHSASRWLVYWYVYRAEFLKVNTTTKFSGMSSFEILITSVKFQLNYWVQNFNIAHALLYMNLLWLGYVNINTLMFLNPYFSGCEYCGLWQWLSQVAEKAIQPAPIVQGASQLGTHYAFQHSALSVRQASVRRLRKPFSQLLLFSDHRSWGHTMHSNTQRWVETSWRTVVSDGHDWTRQSDWTGRLFFLSAVLLSTFILLFLLSNSVSLSYFNLAVPMRKCLGKHSCMS